MVVVFFKDQIPCVSAKWRLSAGRNKKNMNKATIIYRAMDMKRGKYKFKVYS